MIPEKMILADGSEVTVIHFLFHPEFGAERIACMPGLTIFSSGKFRQVPHIRTDDVRAVNCPLCKKTADYSEGIGKIRGKVGVMK